MSAYTPENIYVGERDGYKAWGKYVSTYLGYFFRVHHDLPTPNFLGYVLRV